MGPVLEPELSFTETLKVTVLAVVGVPVMVSVPPVLVEERPSERPVTVQVYPEPLPPVAVMVPV